MHSSKAIAISAPNASCTSVAISGDRNFFEPSICDLNVTPSSLIFLRHGGKTVAISDCEPDVTVLEPLLVDKAKKVMVKLSPMLDLSLALNELKTVRAVHIVAVNNECKELLLILQKESVSSEVSIHCEHIAGNGESRHYTFTLKREKTSPCLLA